MNARIESAQPRLDWQRVSAMSVAFAVHVAAAFVLAMPLLPAAQRATPPIVEVVMRDVPPPPPPIPPETLPEPKAKPMRAPTQVVPKPQPAHDTVVDVAPTPTIPDAPTVAPPTPVPALTDIGEGGGAGGASRVLAYDGALKLRYPPSSIRAREEGAVLLNVLVDAGGRATRVEIARGSGHSALDAAAREAVLRAHFKPVLRNGIAIAAWGVVPIRFRLDEV